MTRWTMDSQESNFDSLSNKSFVDWTRTGMATGTLNATQNPDSVPLPSPLSASASQMTAIRKLSPLEVPEVLLIIFSFLGLHTIRVHASLVCRHWYNIAAPILRARPFIWYNSKNDTRSRESLPPFTVPGPPASDFRAQDPSAS
ncbi:hypothetical protein B0O80DRAFT_294101 [Mortierella sp. GBAus27b]|nr:hypothetical protein B0O80DRAFT_294101 [Mortierella sp. GBAus27b]